MPSRTAPNKRKSTRGASQFHRVKQKTRRPPASHLLIIECEPDKLARQQLDFGTRVAAVFTLLFAKRKIVLVKASSREELCRALGEVRQAHDRFRAILVVGHSNEQGLQLTSDEFYSWQAVGEWVKPFHPEILLLAACRAGRSKGIVHLFEQIGTLRETYASPVMLFRDQTHPFVLLLGAVVKNRKIEQGFVRTIQTAGYLLTDAVIYRFKRNESRNGKELERFGWDLLGQILQRRVATGP